MKQLLPGVLLMSLVSLACRDADRDLPRPYRSLDVPSALLGSSNAQRRGRALFLEHCAFCHGERGDGHGVRREGLVRPPRDFTNPAWRRSTSPRRVFFAIREGIAGTPMPAWTNLSEQDAWNLTAYVLSLGGPT
jgi:mono/diheme cytochrome c family protein